MRTILLIAAAISMMIIASTPVCADPPEEPFQTASALLHIPLEELGNVVVYSVSKHDEKLQTAPSAIYVITGEEIRRSGATSIPDALRLAPGIHVARIDANKWSVSSRGFADRFSNKLLVLQDGRTLYTPTFSGVQWNIQDIMLDDIDRIEVIRGPGSTLWGANAMNGVINIVTKKAGDTLGGLLAAGGGTFEKGFGSLRYGVKAGENLHFRAYGRYFSRDTQRTPAGQDQEGSWDNRSGGFRSEWTPLRTDTLTLQGDIYDSRPGAAYYSGGNILGRWTHEFSKEASTSAQVFYSRAEQRAVSDPDSKYHEQRDTVDIELQHEFKPLAAHKMTLGAGYRFTSDRTGNTPLITLNPLDKSYNLASMFLQDDITILPDHLRLIIGIRGEHNDYTGFEYQPGGRLVWTPDTKHTFWAAVSRAVRTPSRTQDGIEAAVQTLPPGSVAPVEARVKILGSTSLKAESMMAYEAGYRVSPYSELSIDLAFFYNDYEKLIGMEGLAPYMENSYLAIPYRAANNVSGTSWGAEMATVWKPLEFLDFRLSYSWLDTRMASGEPQDLRHMVSQIGAYPEQQFSIRPGLSLPAGMRLDLWFRYVDRLERDNVGDYAEMDARLGWTPAKQLELSLVGQNLLAARHMEFSNDFFGSPATQSERGMYGKVTWKF